MSSNTLHASLLRPAVIHILRSIGFHATKSSVLDSLVEIAARYILLIASQTASFAHDRTLTSIRDLERDSTETKKDLGMHLRPTTTDVRNALTSASFFGQGLSASEEAWAEVMRRPLSDYPAAAREHERRRRDLEDTEDVREFIDWIMGPTAKEMRRIAGVLQDDPRSTPPPNIPLPPTTTPTSHKDDYLDTLKKKTSKSGDSARYSGTVLGRVSEDMKQKRIEGGPVSLSEWRSSLKRKRIEAEDG